jgi:hypothetical protein
MPAAMSKKAETDAKRPSRLTVAVEAADGKIEIPLAAPQEWPSGETANQAAWLNAVKEGRFHLLPDDLKWYDAQDFALIIDGYRFATELGLTDWAQFLADQERVANETGTWPGDAATLWLTLFLEQRKWRANDFEAPDLRSERQLDALCSQLIRSLKTRLALDP